MKKLLLSICLSGLFASIISCNQNNSNNVNPLASDSLSGYLISEHLILDSAINAWYAIEGEDASAIFLTVPGDTIRTLVNSVSVNNYPLDIADDSLSYIGIDTSLNMSSTCNWHVVGNSIIPSFTYNYPVPYPSFTGSFPDTIHKSAGVTFNFSFSGADSISIGIGGDSLGNIITKSFPVTSTSQNFTAAELNNLMPSSYSGTISMMKVESYKSTKQTFNNKHFLFIKYYQHDHGVWVQ